MLGQKLPLFGEKSTPWRLQNAIRGDFRPIRARFFAGDASCESFGATDDTVSGRAAVAERGRRVQPEAAPNRCLAVLRDLFDVTIRTIPPGKRRGSGKATWIGNGRAQSARSVRRGATAGG